MISKEKLHPFVYITVPQRWARDAWKGQCLFLFLWRNTFLRDFRGKEGRKVGFFCDFCAYFCEKWLFPPIDSFSRSAEWEVKFERRFIFCVLNSLRSFTSCTMFSFWRTLFSGLLFFLVLCSVCSFVCTCSCLSAYGSRTLCVRVCARAPAGARVCLFNNNRVRESLFQINLCEYQTIHPREINLSHNSPHFSSICYLQSCQTDF